MATPDLKDLYREIDALGGAPFDGDYNRAIGDALAVLKRYGFAEGVSPTDEAKHELVETLTHLVTDVDELIGQSGGVYGLHLSGDGAPWSDLIEGGCLEGWLLSLAAARAAMAKAPVSTTNTQAA